MGTDLELTVPCKSEDEDLGIQKIPYNRTYSFSFGPNIWMTTQFFCSFQWKDTPRFQFLRRQEGFRNMQRCLLAHGKYKPMVLHPCNHYTRLFDICYDWDP